MGQGGKLMEENKVAEAGQSSIPCDTSSGIHDLEWMHDGQPSIPDILCHFHQKLFIQNHLDILGIIPLEILSWPQGQTLVQGCAAKKEILDP